VKEELRLWSSISSTLPTLRGGKKRGKEGDSAMFTLLHFLSYPVLLLSSGPSGKREPKGPSFDRDGKREKSIAEGKKKKWKNVLLASPLFLFLHSSFEEEEEAPEKGGEKEKGGGKKEFPHRFLLFSFFFLLYFSSLFTRALLTRKRGRKKFEKGGRREIVAISEKEGRPPSPGMLFDAPALITATRLGGGKRKGTHGGKERGGGGKKEGKDSFSSLSRATPGALLMQRGKRGDLRGGRGEKGGGKRRKKDKRPRCRPRRSCSYLGAKATPRRRRGGNSQKKKKKEKGGERKSPSNLLFFYPASRREKERKILKGKKEKGGERRKKGWPHLRASPVRKRNFSREGKKKKEMGRSRKANRVLALFPPLSPHTAPPLWKAREGQKKKETASPPRLGPSGCAVLCGSLRRGKKREGRGGGDQMKEKKKGKKEEEEGGGRGAVSPLSFLKPNQREDLRRRRKKGKRGKSL